MFRSMTLNEYLYQNLYRIGGVNAFKQLQSFYSYVQSCSDWCVLMMCPILFAAAKLDLMLKFLTTFCFENDTGFTCEL